MIKAFFAFIVGFFKGRKSKEPRFPDTPVGGTRRHNL